ncbi:hypothetical protein LJK88_40935 [Paenibacillus sp. P26]|nr:hypothetical protein LJK88_40935 [Paenibacillus sp. P26]
MYEYLYTYACHEDERELCALEPRVPFRRGFAGWLRAKYAKRGGEPKSFCQAEADGTVRSGQLRGDCGTGGGRAAERSDVQGGVCRDGRKRRL